MNFKTFSHSWIVLACLLAGEHASWAAGPDADPAREAGQIQGTVEYCAATGSEGIEVFIPGTSHGARTGPDGKFVMRFVAPGIWNLALEKNSQRLGALSPVEVVKKMITDLDAVHGPIILCADLDGDGYDPLDDCDDSNPSIHPDAPEYCGNGRDDNCDGYTDESCPECTDTDEDGFYAQLGCGLVDCNDNSPAVSPGAEESCGDGVDNDCDGQIDEDDAFNALTFYFDNDADGIGDSAISMTACVPLPGWMSIGGDCDDSEPAVYPGAPEICDSLDNDCNDLIDDYCSNQICTAEEASVFEICWAACSIQGGQCLLDCLALVSSDCGSAIDDLGVCLLGTNCFFQTEHDPRICAYDLCTDFWEAVFGNAIPTECTVGASLSCGTDVGACVPGSRACVEPGRWADECVGAIRPQDEMCDGIDNDCDNQIDEEGEVVDGVLQYSDWDGDGYGLEFSAEIVCLETPGWAVDGGDCNDGNAQVHPGAPEVCDSLDNDCNGQVDEMVAQSFWLDSDADGYGDSHTLVRACSRPEGYAPTGGDCDDARDDIHPDATEICDDSDNDCDGHIDEVGDVVDGELHYRDFDEDGYGQQISASLACPGTPGWTLYGGDCNEGDPDINPGAQEICDSLDNDCNGQVDEGFDNDSDGIADCFDEDDDNDGVLDVPDIAPFDPDRCEDIDNDTCDDCSVGSDDFGPSADNNPLNDGPDADHDGLCDPGDPNPHG